MGTKFTKKKLSRIFLAALAVLLFACIPAVAMATGEDDIPVTEIDNTLTVTEEMATPASTESVPDLASIPQDIPAIDETYFDTATTIMLFDAETGEEIYSKNPDGKIYPASTTKLLSAAIAIEQGIADKNVTVAVCADDYSPDNSLMGLVRSETIPGIDLLYGMMLSSGNDAATSVAMEIAGSSDAFSQMMNEKALEIGMTSSNFKNACGLHNEDHYSTGADMKKLAMYAFKNDLLMDICGTKEYIVDPTDLCIEQRTLKNTNKLLYRSKDTDPDFTYAYTTGMKTGSTYAAGGCVIASAEKDGQAYIAMVFGDSAEAGANRWRIAQTLFDYAFTNYAKVYPAQYIDDYSVTEYVRNAAANEPNGGKVTFTASVDAFANEGILVSAYEAAALETGAMSITTQVTLDTILAAPFDEGQQVGEVKYYIGDRLLGTSPLKASKRVYAEGEEELQSTAITKENNEYWEKTDILQEVGQNQSVLWWLLIPIGVIAFIIIRAFVMNKRKSRIRRTGTARQMGYRVPMRSGRKRNTRYHGRYR